jgi:HNH endonuclease
MFTDAFVKDFWARVEKLSDQDCWLWTESLTPAGYGRIRIGKRRKRFVHRIAYELLIGPIPEGMTLDHLCRVRHCVNPAHLEPVTMRENNLRGVSPWAINARKTHCPKGHPLSGSNLCFDAKGYRHCHKCLRNAGVERARKKRASRRINPDPVYVWVKTKKVPPTMAKEKGRRSEEGRP